MTPAPTRVCPGAAAWGGISAEVGGGSFEALLVSTAGALRLIEPFMGEDLRGVGGSLRLHRPTAAAWTADGRELFYRRGRQLLAAPVRSSSGLDLGRAAVLFEGSYHDNIAPTRSYDVTPDGRFLMVTEPAEALIRRPLAQSDYSPATNDGT